MKMHMMSSERKLSRMKCWLSVAVFLPLLGCMIEALLLWIPGLHLDVWYDRTSMSKTALMTALVITALETVPAVLFYYTGHHIENGWRMPATVCAVLVLAAYIGGAVLWNKYSTLNWTWYDGMTVAVRGISGIVTVLYALRLSEKRDRRLSWLMLTLWIGMTGTQTEMFIREATAATTDVETVQCLVHGIAYMLMDLSLGMAYYNGFLPSDRPKPTM